MQSTKGNAYVARWLERRRGEPSPSDRVQREDAPAAAEAAGPTSDSVLNEWLTLHPDQHLSSDTAWIFEQWPGGGSMADLDAGFGADVQALIDFTTAVSGEFTVISFARSPQKQHVMHVSQYIRRALMGYGSYKFSSWSGVAAAKALTGAERTAALTAITNPELLNVVWDTGTGVTSKTHATAIAGPGGYGIGANNPCANGGPTYSWPTGNTSESNHGDGKAVDVTPASLPNEVTVTEAQARNWPTVTALNAAFGAANVAVPAAGPPAPTAGDPAPAIPAAPGAGATSYTIKGLSAVAKRDAFYELFFRVRSAARAGFTDPEHFQAP